MPVGTLKIRNQKNTSEGKMLATESEIYFHIVGGYAHQIHEAHAEEAEHHGD